MHLKMKGLISFHMNLAGVTPRSYLGLFLSEMEILVFQSSKRQYKFQRIHIIQQEKPSTPEGWLSKKSVAFQDACLAVLVPVLRF